MNVAGKSPAARVSSRDSCRLMGRLYTGHLEQKWQQNGVRGEQRKPFKKMQRR